jgi:hypothetical protein
LTADIETLVALIVHMLAADPVMPLEAVFPAKAGVATSPAHDNAITAIRLHRIQRLVKIVINLFNPVQLVGVRVIVTVPV